MWYDTGGERGGGGGGPPPPPPGPLPPSPNINSHSKVRPAGKMDFTIGLLLFKHHELKKQTHIRLQVEQKRG